MDPHSGIIGRAVVIPLGIEVAVPDSDSDRLSQKAHNDVDAQRLYKALCLEI